MTRKIQEGTMVFKNQRFVKPSYNSGPTRFLYVSGNESLGVSRDLLVTFFEKFGELDFSQGDPIDLVVNRRFCFISYVNVISAISAYEYFQEKRCIDALSNLKIQQVHFAAEKVEPKAPPEPECTSESDSVNVPGLFVVNDFVTESEEAALIAEFDSDPSVWKMNLQRRVQHFGFPFNYRTLMLDYTKPTPPLTQSCLALGDRINRLYTDLTVDNENQTNIVTGVNDTNESSRDAKTVESVDSSPVLPLNQLTINEYWPGQGIASHTDTEACFGPVIFVLNLGSGIVMNFTKNSARKAHTSATAQSSEDTVDGKDTDHGDEVDEEEEQQNRDKSDRTDSRERKCVYLPVRSLLILSGPARYEYSHGISLRKFDQVNRTLIPRGRRLSLTFRHALRPGNISSAALQSPDIEMDHVVRVYDNIAVHWNHTRGKRKVWWHRVKDFLDALPVGTLLADIGSGDGKYFGVNPNITAIGCDRSIKLLEVSRDPQNDTFCCDAVSLPFVSDMFDATVCIAVLHHLSTVERRYAVISELVRITRPGGHIMIQAWALEQGEDSKKVFETQDTMVPWKLNKRFLMTSEDNTVDSSVTSTIEGKSAIKSKLNVAVEDQEPVLTPSELHTLTGNCQHVKEEKGGDLIFQRYCHVYKEGELESLCSSVPNCSIDETGWDKGNWFVRLTKISDDRLTNSGVGRDTVIPVHKARTVVM